MLWNGLHIFQYKVQVEQQLKHKDFTAFAEFENWCVFSILADESYLISVIYFGEGVFHVKQKANKHDIKILGIERTQDLWERARKKE